MKKEHLGVGISNALASIIANDFGFDFFWVSSFELSALNGLLDLELISIDEISKTVQSINLTTNVPIIVDMDSGHGNAIQAYYASRKIFNSGADAICIEDYHHSKVCSLINGVDRELAPIKDQVDKIKKIKAASKNKKVIARSESLVCGDSVHSTIERFEAYIQEGGVESIFIQSKQREAGDLKKVANHFREKVDIYVTPTCFPEEIYDDLYASGVTHIILANFGIRKMFEALKYIYSVASTSDSAKVLDANTPSYTELIKVLTSNNPFAKLTK